MGMPSVPGWHGKPVVIVSYGGHSGVKAACKVRRVFHGAGKNIAESKPALLS